MKLDLERGVRKIGRGVGLGVAEALEQHGPSKGEEPGWRAEQLAGGFLRGVERGLEDDDLRRTVSRAISDAADTAISAVLARSLDAQEISEEAARALARGVLDELRRQLGHHGDGPLSQAIGASLQRFARNAGRALVPLLLPVAALGLVAGALLVVRKR